MTFCPRLTEIVSWEPCSHQLSAGHSGDMTWRDTIVSHYEELHHICSHTVSQGLSPRHCLWWQPVQPSRTVRWRSWKQKHTTWTTEDSARYVLPNGAERFIKIFWTNSVARNSEWPLRPAWSCPLAPGWDLLHCTTHHRKLISSPEEPAGSSELIIECMPPSHDTCREV